MGRPRKSSAGGKRKKDDAVAASAAEAAGGPAKRKRVKAPAEPKPEPQYFEEKRSLEDLWQAAFPVGTEWENIDKIKEINWSFRNLEEAFEEGGEFYGQTVYIFGSTEPQLLTVKGEQKVVLIPVVVAVVSPIPPSDQIGVKSVQREKEEILSMKAMKMTWAPYIPLEYRLSQAERLKTQIFTLACTQRRTALKHLNIERVKQFDYCLPYLQPLTEEDDENDTVVNIMFPLEPPIVCDFDWELDDLEEFTTELIMEETLPEDKKEEFKEYVKEQVRERRKQQREKKAARRKAIEEMDPKKRSALENLKVYKFYPVQTPDIPDISKVKVPYINRYYGKAHVLK